MNAGRAVAFNADDNRRGGRKREERKKKKKRIGSTDRFSSRSRGNLFSRYRESTLGDLQGVTSLFAVSVRVFTRQHHHDETTNRSVAAFAFPAPRRVKVSSASVSPPSVPPPISREIESRLTRRVNQLIAGSMVPATRNHGRDFSWRPRFHASRAANGKSSLRANR